ncbi:protein OBERON 4-like [Pyrus ussuriensis x Pyrus communis]|uniref:Protein OBERON 4-like n=1 Tax=Pyrus ussuriensis x Pyrus communis TaxID=2448454 RepID=A0A5N5EUB5_9ROSA|nr:protein OBERON 4-like [Pyrus ussuriensis x Pyrus communis]KAB2594609.1 protein OBERON 4-like [Pyrus ussuriensis x Pyrus communis]
MMEHELDGFDRSKGTDRYNRDGGGYDRNLMHWSESLSMSRRSPAELLKGFRSKRDRSRHKGNGSRALSWRSFWKELEEKGGGKGFRDMRSPTWSNSRYSGSEQSKVEAMKVRVRLVWVIARDFEKIHFDNDLLQIVETLWNPSINLILIGQAV